MDFKSRACMWSRLEVVVDKTRVSVRLRIVGNESEYGYECFSVSISMTVNTSMIVLVCVSLPVRGFANA